jgi:hypothetical protein
MNFGLVRNIMLLFLMLSLSSCDKNSFTSCFQSAGKDDISILQVDTFTKLDIRDRFEIHFIQDSSYWVELRGKSNLIEHLSFETENNTLIVSDDNKCKLFKGYHTTQIYLHFNTLDVILLDGSSELYSDDTLDFENLFIESHADMSRWDLKINTKKLDVKLHAVVGEMTVSGISDITYLYSSGSNHLFFKDLISRRANINHSGLGNMHLTATDQFGATVFKQGNIYCYGQPTSKSVNHGPEGTGKVYFLD